MAAAHGHLPSLSRRPIRPRRLAAIIAGALLAAAAAPSVLAAGVARAAPEPPLLLEPLWSGLPTVTGIVHAGDERLFVVLQEGRILVYEHGVMREPAFLDLRDRVSSLGEHGLLGLAFHPRHGENGRFFVAYSDHRGRLVVARYQVSDEPDAADAASGVLLLALQGYGLGHNSGQLQFGPDGYLYVGVGSSPMLGDAHCAGQRLDNPRGKILRIDVDSGDQAAPYHAVPATNPFPAGPVPEVWAYGLRNPWRFSFDRATGDLYVGDVGEAHREEIDFQPAASPGGENYGWARMEGTYCADLVKPCFDPVPPCGDPGFAAPVLEHEHEQRDGHGFCAIIGGFVYRGSQIPQLVGRYLYGDHCSGRLFAARRQEVGWSTEELGIALPGLSAFGEDAAGEIYLGTATGVLAALATWPGRVAPAPCVPGEGRLCLAQGRFRVAARWTDALGRSDLAHGVPLTADSGYFWFFDPDNVELVVKVLDGCSTGLPGRWFFAAGLTDVEVDLRILDLVTGAERRYPHAGGTPFQPILDTGAFGCD